MMGILGHLLYAKSSKSEGYYYLQTVCSLRLVSNVLDTIKGGRERAEPLQEVKRCGLEKIHADTGSCHRRNLFDKAVLRSADISHVPATETHVMQATLLTLESDQVPLANIATGPKKHLLPELVKEEVPIALDKEAERELSQAEVAPALVGGAFALSALLIPLPKVAEVEGDSQPPVIDQEVVSGDALAFAQTGSGISART
ncbi:uncharacterized protein A4U43_C07F31250 [Asparagus officinalis]|uniref:Uncharacterized protein n=1 Tax=Asparagus officinalis TaxID=4686 RepID=A0A5P1EJD1_ASPOF|nr:uncharacterized protein A4U43_C07F31250 [Asparagus officinalis]